MSCPARLACPNPVPDLLLAKLELVTRVTWKRELDLVGVGNGMPEGDMGDW